MGSGTARRAPLAGVSELATLIGSLESNQAMVLGALRPGLPDEVRVTTKAKLKNGAANVIARTAEDVVYRAGRPAFMLFDTDSKGMPDAIAAKIEQAGGIWQALITLPVPDFRAPIPANGCRAQRIFISTAPSRTVPTSSAS
jgi:hypothetical protein